MCATGLSEEGPDRGFTCLEKEGLLAKQGMSPADYDALAPSSKYWPSFDVPTASEEILLDVIKTPSRPCSSTRRRWLTSSRKKSWAFRRDAAETDHHAPVEP